MTATYSLAAVAAELGIADDMVDATRWLTRQIVAGRIRARRIGRQWRMTRADIDAALEVWANVPEPTPATASRAAGEVPVIGRPSTVSLLRRRAAR